MIFGFFYERKLIMNGGITKLIEKLLNYLTEPDEERIKAALDPL